MYEAILETQRGIEGMLMEVSAATWCILLDAQHATWAWQGVGPADYMEIGTFKGKAASILASFAAEYGNALTVVDPVVLPQTRDLLNAITERMRFIEAPSERLRYGDFHRDNLRHIGFVHIDGMHTYSAVLSDLAVCEELVSDFGLICLDDFHSDMYPQVSAAAYKYLSSGLSDLSLFLVGFNKAYLCRNGAKHYFADFVGQHLAYGLEDAGHPVSLVKNDRHDSFDAYALVPFQGERFIGPGFAVGTA